MDGMEMSRQSPHLLEGGGGSPERPLQSLEILRDLWIKLIPINNSEGPSRKAKSGLSQVLAQPDSLSSCIADVGAT